MTTVAQALYLLLLTTVMAIASFVGGLIPLKITMSSTKINYFSVFSMGILVGTSLVLIIPEGVDTLYESLDIEDIKVAPRIVGISLLLGFILMYALDNLSTILSSCNIELKFNYSILNTATTHFPVGDSLKSVLNNSLTLGLLFHAIVDGIALGSSFADGNSSFEIIFFVVIVIHKLPTSFSLTSLLIKQGINTQIVQIHLAIFALMSPLSAITTFSILALTNLNDNKFAIGILFLFSAGTFLYVVIHVMLEVTASEEEPPQSSQSEETLTPPGHTALSGIELVISMVGMLLPIILSFLAD